MACLQSNVSPSEAELTLERFCRFRETHVFDDSPREWTYPCTPGPLDNTSEFKGREIFCPLTKRRQPC